MKTKTYPSTNALIHESSPYLLQHAHNPVEWYPWGDSALEQARQQDKPLLISIGYAACHWCHVMAHECFEDEEVARVMNDNYICIKVDREEHPDVDHFFMTAIQLTGTQGGWPLNIIAMPNGQPLWGGTYFPKEQWISALKKIFLLFKTDRPKLTQHALNLTRGIQQVSLPLPGEQIDDTLLSRLIDTVNTGHSSWDMTHGGHRGAPKFPMPGMLNFLLHLQHLRSDPKSKEFLEVSLDKMAYGGIFDQIGGGFARYSVDAVWKVPHFEKMLYDNAQLIGLYAQAYSVFKKPLYKQVAYATAEFLRREMTHSSGAVYSSLDADSDGEEGQFYTWKKPELKELLGEEYDLFADYFNLNDGGHWEEGRYILMRIHPDEIFSQKHQLSLSALNDMVKRWKSLLLRKRQQRNRPALDDKVITSWNALMIEGLCQAHKAFGDTLFCNTALANARFISSQLLSDEGRLFHTWKEGKASIPGFMDDYAHTISAFISLFETTGEEIWVTRAERMTDYVLLHFFEPKHHLFRFSEKKHSRLPAEHYQIEDQTTPSSNSVMGHNFRRLASLTGKPVYQEMATGLLQSAFPQFLQHPWSYTNWGRLALLMQATLYEVVVSGEGAIETLKQMQKKYRPNVVWAPLVKAGNLPLTQHRLGTGPATIYVCSQGACQLPVNSVSEAEKLLK
jgi:uncharacterized protein YyaL (SSP411 family)